MGIFAPALTATPLTAAAVTPTPEFHAFPAFLAAFCLICAHQ
jgi:hypothetical protein